MQATSIGSAVGRDYVRILIPWGEGGGLLVIDCLFLFMFSFLKPQIPGLSLVGGFQNTGGMGKYILIDSISLPYL